MTAEISVPGLKNEACARIILIAVGRQAGVKQGSAFNFQQKIIIVRYESLVTALKNIEFAIAEAGFQANEVPAKEEAARALPPECR